MKRIAIIFKNKAVSIIPKISNIYPLWYYLSDDYSHFINLKEKFGSMIEIRNLSGLFDETFQEIKSAILDVIAAINKENNSLYWWGSQTASRNSASTPLIRNITYLFCARKILSGTDEGLVFIVDSKALACCIKAVAEETSYQVITWNGLKESIDVIRLPFLNCARVFYFFWQALQSRIAAFRLLKVLSAPKINNTKRIVIRSWITKDTFDKSGRFKDRNFGTLPEWLRLRGYDVWTLPMFFNLSMSLKEVYALMRSKEHIFLIPDLYLRLSDYVGVFRNGIRVFKMKLTNVKLHGIDIAPLFNETLRKEGFAPSLLILNLCYPMLQRLSELGYEIDAFYYSFENNPPEKPFILGCRKFFPNSKIIAFQHTTFFPNQLAYHLAPGEERYHPLPDKIICSGQIYKRMFEEAGFPSEILTSGPNLRFKAVHSNGNSNNSACTSVKKLLLPLPGLSDYKLTFELFYKVHNALSGMDGYGIYIRTHPVLSRSVIIKFLNEIKMSSYEFADEGIIQDWLPETYAVISAGVSITILEAVTMGVPVIRMIPDNTVYYDPFLWPDYPLRPVNTAPAIRRQLQLIGDFIRDGNDIFQRIGKKVLSEYFTEPTDENLSIFL